MDDLELIKCADLTLYAAAIGYEKDKRESYRTGTVMRRGPDKIVISKKPSGHYTFFSVRSDNDKGTIIDFCISRTGKSTGDAIRGLREWLSISPAPANDNAAPLIVAPERNIKAVQFRWQAMKVARRHDYLEKERGIPALIFGQHWRFRGLVRNDNYGNACFAHFNAEELCGYEIRGPRFKGFSKAGEKGLFRSKRRDDDIRLIFSESAVECLSVCTLMDDGRTRYASVAGQFNDAQRQLVRSEIERLRSGEFVAAMNADAAGRRMADMVREEVERSAGDSLTFNRIEPDAKDWNDVLTATQRPDIIRMRGLLAVSA